MAQYFHVHQSHWLTNHFITLLMHNDYGSPSSSDLQCDVVSLLQQFDDGIITSYLDK